MQVLHGILWENRSLARSLPLIYTLHRGTGGARAGQGAALNGASKAGRGEKRRCQRRETRCETWWVQVPRRNGGPPAASASCVVTGDGGTKRRQRLLRPGASIPKETHRGGPRGLRTRGQQGGAVTAWRLPPDRGRWPRHREGPPTRKDALGTRAEGFPGSWEILLVRPQESPGVGVAGSPRSRAVGRVSRTRRLSNPLEAAGSNPGPTHGGSGEDR